MKASPSLLRLPLGRPGPPGLPGAKGGARPPVFSPLENPSSLMTVLHLWKFRGLACITSDMAQPKNPPISIRLPADVLAVLEREAKPGEARNAVIVRLLREAGAPTVKLPAPMRQGAEPKRDVPAMGLTKAASREEFAEEFPPVPDQPRYPVPLAGTFKRPIYQKGRKR